MKAIPSEQWRAMHVGEARIAFWVYSSWKSLPSGEKVVGLRSYCGVNVCVGVGVGVMWVL
jgi:hypothetical protein